MFEHTSRYFVIEDSIYITPDGREIRYKRRRFLPQGEEIPAVTEVITAENDRLDLLADDHLGDALQFWQICDANNALNPFDLVGEYGRFLRIPLPQFQEPR